MDHLNDLQRMCTDLTGEGELVVGSIYGLREWFLERDGLYGHNWYSWNAAGVNEATCDVFPRTYSRTFYNYTPNEIVWDVQNTLRNMFDQHSQAVSVTVRVGSDVQTTEFTRKDFLDDVSTWFKKLYPDGGRVDLDVTFTPDEDVHSIAMPACTCGFYAFTDSLSLDENSSRTSDAIYGIVRAWGQVTVGTKGFRAQYAEIMGLTEPRVCEYFGRMTDLVPRSVPVYYGLDQLLTRFEELRDGSSE